MGRAKMYAPRTPHVSLPHVLSGRSLHWRQEAHGKQWWRIKDRAYLQVAPALLPRNNLAAAQVAAGRSKLPQVKTCQVISVRFISTHINFCMNKYFVLQYFLMQDNYLL